MKSKTTGFTLVEMLVALAIGASIAALSYRALQGIIIADEKIGKVTQRLDEVDRVWQSLENDLLFARERTWIDSFGQPQSALNGKLADRQSLCDVLVGGENEYVLLFIRDNRSNLLNQPRSDLMIVRYRLSLDKSDDDKPQETCSLWRDFWSPVDAAGEPAVQQRLLLSGIRKLDIKYCSRDLLLPATTCATGWPTTPGVTTELPGVIGVELTVDGLGDINRSFLLTVPLK